ncbi:MAG: serine/threonine-protein kinase, partial [Acidobacteriota bacterium]
MPERVGPWRLLGELGRGGMGVVYEAIRDDEHFEQPAALKIIRHGLADEQLVQRFLRERQILAHMEHPGIARLLDGGVTEDGRPWLALELVEGMALDDYCRTHDMSLEDRLQLFSQICEIVEYAHRNLVVHRDLKPSNVLVDSGGRVRLLDFGIAKVLHDEKTRTSLTSSGGQPMTPGYGAPELLFGGPVTTATDVYSLGMVLYEILSGQPAFRRSSEPGRTGLLSILSAEPARLSSLAEEAEQDSAGERIKAYAKRLEGELDAIAAKSIQLEPTYRYSSAEALRQDIQRFLRGDPVSALPDSWTYRAKKAMGRHWKAAAVAMALLVSLSLGLGVALWQSRVAAHERDIAWESSEHTKEVKQFVVDLFRNSDPKEPGSAELTAAQLLDRGIERAQEDWAEHRPDLQMELLTTIADVSSSLGSHEKARFLLKQAQQLDPGPEPRNQLRLAAVL